MAFFLVLFFISGFLIIFTFPCSLLFFPNKIIAKFRIFLSRCSCPSVSSLVSFYKNRHRLINWYTDLLSHSPTQTIILHRVGAQRTIVTANPDNVEYILKTNFHNFPKGKPFTDLLGDFLGLGIFNVDGQMWSVQRKLASHEFTTKSLREFVVGVLEEEVQNRLIPILDAAADVGRILDMQDVLRRFAFDTICKVSMGMDPCCLDDLSKPPPQLATAFDAASGISAMRGTAPVSAIWKLKRMFNLGMEKDLKEAVALVHSCVDEMIRSKRQSMVESSGGDLLSRFLEAGIDDVIVRDMVISFLMAGRDTTSAAVTWLLWLLTGHREIENQVVEEITASSGDHSLSFDDLKQMNFIKACLCESMRLYPPVVWDSKHAAKDDVLPDGTPVQKGNRVTYFQYGMGRMEALWGKDRLEFRPDRWLDEGGAVKAVSPYKFPVFQAGPRVCLGKEMAFIQMKYVVAAILRRFELLPARSEPPVFLPLLTAHMAGGFNVRVSCRRSNF